jgi:hypothetical protein
MWTVHTELPGYRIQIARRCSRASNARTQLPLIRTNGCRFRSNAGAFWRVTDHYSGTPFRWFLPIFGRNPVKESETFSEYGFQQTRGFRALKLWVTLAHAGTLGLKEQIARQIALARYLEQRIDATPHFELPSKGNSRSFASGTFHGDLRATRKHSIH